MRRSVSLAVAAVAASVLSTAGASTASVVSSKPEPIILQAMVEAPPARVWQALTTPEGVHSFFSEQALVEPKIGGAYEMYFAPENPVGFKGTEGVRILAMEEPSRFFISWNAPRSYPQYRDQKTVVEFELEPVGESRTLVRLTHSGWGRGPGWGQVRDYFGNAWKVILGRLQYRFDKGPVNWKDTPDGAAYFKAAP